MIKPHIIGPSFSTFTRSVRLYAQELGLHYTHGMSYHGIDLTFDSVGLIKLNPFAKVPVLVHGERVLFETVAICYYLDHLAERHKSMIPQDLDERFEIEQWASALITEVDSLLVRQYLLEFTFPKGENGEVRLDKIETLEPDVIYVLNVLSKQLGNREFLCGEYYSVADALLIPMLDYLGNTLQRPILFKDAGNLLLYLETMRERASSQKVLV